LNVKIQGSEMIQIDPNNLLDLRLPFSLKPLRKPINRPPLTSTHSPSSADTT
jgi:hypothetical protein